MPRIADPAIENEIDCFVRSRLSMHGLPTSPQADAHRLVRRVALGLTGLPPGRHAEESPEFAAVVEQFVRNPTTEQFEPIVDALLASSAFGEHWAAMWLDLARYADTVGYAGDEERTIWPWRDWVIQAFNDNLPYDQFTIEQLAGDLLPTPTASQRLATAFHRNTLINNEGGTNDEEFRTIAVKDRSSTTASVWMGLTLRCAECHSHKYDPISQREYYQFLDFFNQTADADRNDEEPRMEVAPFGRELAADEPTADVRPPSPIRVPILEELPAEKRRETRVMQRGNYRSLGDQVTAATPAAFHPLDRGHAQESTGTCPLAGEPGQSAHGACDGESFLGETVWQGDRGNRGGFWNTGHAAIASAAARLAGRRFSTTSMGREAPAQENRYVRDLSASQPCRPAESRARSPQSLAFARPPFPPVG